MKDDENWVNDLAQRYADACKPLWRANTKKGVSGVGKTEAAVEIPHELLGGNGDAHPDVDAADAPAVHHSHAADTPCETRKANALAGMSLVKRGGTVMMEGASFKVVKIKRMKEQLKR